MSSSAPARHHARLQMASTAEIVGGKVDVIQGRLIAIYQWPIQTLVHADGIRMSKANFGSSF
jgi:hypothetical protein